MSRFAIVAGILALTGSISGSTIQEGNAYGTVKPFSLRLQALENVGDQTDVYLTVVADDSSFALPTLAKTIQLKHLDAAGVLLWTQNYKDVALADGRVTYTFYGLSMGSSFTAQVLVQTPQTVNTERLFATAGVVLRPDITIEKVIAPTNVRAGQSFDIEAILTELNGTLESACDVILCLNEIPAEYNPVDRVNTVVVPRGGMASAILSLSIPDPGIYTLVVKADNVIPSDYDTSNNSAQRQIEVLPNATPIPFSLSYEEFFGERSSGQTRGGFGSSSFQNSLRGNYENLSYQSPLQTIQWPVEELTVEITADGVRRVSASYQNAQPTINYVPPYSGWGGSRPWEQWETFSREIQPGDVILIERYTNGHGANSNVVRFTHAQTDYIYYSGGWIGHWSWYGQSQVSRSGVRWGVRSDIQSNVLVSFGGNTYGGRATLTPIQFEHQGPGQTTSTGGGWWPTTYYNYWNYDRWYGSASGMTNP